MAIIHQMGPTTTKITSGGRLVIPANYRRELGLNDGDTVTLRVQDGELRILSVRQAVRRAQEIVRKYIPAERSLVDELIAERRRETELE